MEHDVIVVGSGGAALTAALSASDGGASVLLLEKGEFLGGTTAVSGGVAWLPLNHHMAEFGITDTRSEALEYIDRLSLGQGAGVEVIEAYVDNAAKMLAYLESATPLRMLPLDGFADYYHGRQDVPGSKPFGRSVQAVPFAAERELGEWARLVAQRADHPALKASPIRNEPLLSASTESTDPLVRQGTALIAALMKGVRDRRIDVKLSTAAVDLVMEGDEVVGVRAVGPNGPVSLRARLGVILACGGFEWNRSMVRSFLGYEVNPLTCPNNVGDGLRMAMRAGAALDNMTSYWGNAAMFDPRVVLDGEPAPQFAVGRGAPGSIIVDSSGRRFVLEDIPYNDFPRSLVQVDAVALGYPHQPAWLILDSESKHSGGAAAVGGSPEPDGAVSAETPEALAGLVGIDPVALSQTIERFNSGVDAGSDPDFPDAAVIAIHKREWQRIASPPYYAIPIFPASLGTNGGPRIDVHARVLNNVNEPIRGLYAAGNAAASPFGPAYPGGGAPIGLGMTFGYLAGEHAAGAAAPSVRSNEIAGVTSAEMAAP